MDRLAVYVDLFWTVYILRAVDRQFGLNDDLFDTLSGRPFDCLIMIVHEGGSLIGFTATNLAQLSLWIGFETPLFLRCPKERKKNKKQKSQEQSKLS